MSLFSHLLEEVSNQKDYPLSGVLLKAKVIAARLRSRKFGAWVDSEINGYDRKSPPPEYRVLPSALIGEFAGIHYSEARTPLSISHLEPKLRDLFSKHEEYNGISYIEDLLRESDAEIGFYLDGKIVNYMRQNGTRIDEMILNRVFKRTGRQAYNQLLLSVRSRLLDFLLEMADKYPNLAKDDSATASVNPDEVDAAVDTKVYHNCTVIDGAEMRDVYQAGQAGAMGPGAGAEDMNFIQILREAKGESSLADLASELEKLRGTLLIESKTAEQDATVSAIAEAEVAAKKGDAKGVLGYLKKAGSWSLDAATRIGTAVAAKAIEKSMGL